MSSLFFALLGVVLISVSWKKIWQVTLLDFTRDKLFNLRDETRLFFIKNGYGPDHYMYKNIRRQLNLYLRHAESVTLLSFISFIVAIKRNPRYMVTLDKELKKTFLTPDPKLKDFVEHIRAQAADILTVYVFYRNFFFTMTAICVLLVRVLKFFIIKLAYCLQYLFFNKINIVPQIASMPVLLALLSVYSFVSSAPFTMEKYTVSSPAASIDKC